MVEEYSGWLFSNMRDNEERRPQPATAEVLGAFRLPVLLIVGQEDAADFREIGEEVVRRVPGAKQHVVRDAGHMPNLEQPEDFNQALLEFLDANE